MQFLCSTCGKKLRIPDHHTNPRVRCPNCKSVFRPLEPKGPVMAEAVLAEPSSARPSRAERPIPRPAAPPQEKKFSHLIGIGMMLLVFVGPQIAKIWNRADRRAPPPVNVEIEEEMREALRRQRAKEEKRRREKKEAEGMEAEEMEAEGRDGG